MLGTANHAAICRLYHSNLRFDIAGATTVLLNICPSWITVRARCPGFSLVHQDSSSQKAMRSTQNFDHIASLAERQGDDKVAVQKRTKLRAGGKRKSEIIARDSNYRVHQIWRNRAIVRATTFCRMIISVIPPIDVCPYAPKVK